MYAALLQGEAHLKRGNYRDAIARLKEARKLAGLLARAIRPRTRVPRGGLVRRGGRRVRRLRETPRRGCRGLPRRGPDLPRVSAGSTDYLGRTREGLKSPGAAEAFQTFLGFQTGEGGRSRPTPPPARRQMKSPCRVIRSGRYGAPAGGSRSTLDRDRHCRRAAARIGDPAGSSPRGDQGAVEARPDEPRPSARRAQVSAQSKATATGAFGSWPGSRCRRSAAAGARSSPGPRRNRRIPVEDEPLVVDRNVLRLVAPAVGS